MNVILVPLTYNGVVLVYNQRKQGWEFPGGKSEGNEDAIEAIKREIKEEAGLVIVNLKFVKTFKNNLVFVAKVLEIKGGLMAHKLFPVLPYDLSYSREEYVQLLEEAKQKLNDDKIQSLI